MEEVMYGPTPSIIIERFDSAPPEKIFKSPKNWFPAKKDRNCSMSTTGTGIVDANRKTASKKRTKIILLRNSRILNSNKSF